MLKHCQIVRVTHRPAKEEFTVTLKVKAEDMNNEQLAILAAGENDGTSVNAEFSIETI